MQKVAIFGSTGSIGTTTLRVVEENPELFSANTLVAGRNVKKLIEQIERFSPRHVYITDSKDAVHIKETFPNLDVYYGEEGMWDISRLRDSDIAVSALVGIAGLEPTYNMIQNTRKVALANKEVLVTGGDLIMSLARECGTKLLTVDSEHSAIMQCLNGEKNNPIDKILLTASGGPFFDKEITEDITPEQALNHPTWKMGPKVTIDSSTMMNKGFEVIEAHWLFNVPSDKIEVVVHRQSLVHSMVQFVDGTIMANIGPKDMQLPIAYALNYPNRLENKIQKLNLFEIGNLRFEKPNLNKFKCLKLAFDAIKAGNSYQIVLNAANEVAVAAFLEGKIKYTDIPRCIETALEQHIGTRLYSVDDILELDNETRKKNSNINFFNEEQGVGAILISISSNSLFYYMFEKLKCYLEYVFKLIRKNLYEMHFCRNMSMKLHLPNELSGGQQQKVAIGRALMMKPTMILADEPTGNLDSKSSNEIIQLLKKINKDYNQTIIMITHNLEIAKLADRIIKLEDGKIV